MPIPVSRMSIYFRPERYSCDEVRGYYDGLIWNLVEGLGITGYQTHNFAQCHRQRCHTASPRPGR